MDKITLDHPEFVQARERFEKLEAEHCRSRERQIELDALSTTRAKSRAELLSRNAERETLRERSPILEEELEEARKALEHLRNQLSVQLCQPSHKIFGVEVQRIVGAIQTIIEANARLIALHDELERNGIATGSLPNGLFGVAGGYWSKEFPMAGYISQVGDYLKHN